MTTILLIYLHELYQSQKNSALTLILLKPIIVWARDESTLKNLPVLPEEDQVGMKNEHTGSLRDELDGLAQQLEELIATCSQLRSENEKLRLVEETLSVEKEELVSRNREAKRRIDLVVDRLRSTQTA
tara:strand:- start:590 stop:973 length:384 start_codon:yes stop_codon:yes gene_type:complete